MIEIGVNVHTSFGERKLQVRRFVTHEKLRGTIAVAYCIERVSLEIGSVDILKHAEPHEVDPVPIFFQVMRLESATRISNLEEIVMYVYRFSSVGCAHDFRPSKGGKWCAKCGARE